MRGHRRRSNASQSKSRARREGERCHAHTAPRRACLRSGSGFAEARVPLSRAVLPHSQQLGNDTARRHIAEKKVSPRGRVQPRGTASSSHALAPPPLFPLCFGMIVSLRPRHRARARRRRSRRRAARRAQRRASRLLRALLSSTSYARDAPSSNSPPRIERDRSIDGTTHVVLQRCRLALNRAECVFLGSRGDRRSSAGVRCDSPMAQRRERRDKRARARVTTKKVPRTSITSRRNLGARTIARTDASGHIETTSPPPPPPPPPPLGSRSTSQ